MFTRSSSANGEAVRGIQDWSIISATALFIVQLSCIAASPPTKLLVDAGWCWFQEERALIVGDQLVFGSVANGRNSDGRPDPSRRGHVEVTRVDLTTQAVKTTVIGNRLQADDHDNPALWLRPDGRMVALFSKHRNDYLTVCASQHPTTTVLGQTDCHQHP